jgi:hypothetical protein
MSPTSGKNFSQIGVCQHTYPNDTNSVTCVFLWKRVKIWMSEFGVIPILGNQKRFLYQNEGSMSPTSGKNFSKIGVCQHTYPNDTNSVIIAFFALFSLLGLFFAIYGKA